MKMKIKEIVKIRKLETEFSEEEFYYICRCLKKLSIYHDKDINGFTEEFFDSLIELEGGKIKDDNAKRNM